MKEMLFTPWEEGDRRSIPTARVVGGKGRGLYWLAANGFPVPPTWVLSTSAFDMAVERAGLKKAIAEIQQAIAGLGNDWMTMQQTLDALEPKRVEIAEALRQAKLPDRVGAALADLPLEPAQWAVRSSATVEDDPIHTFAGQFVSLLSVPRGMPLWDAVRLVWASNFGQAALAYCSQNHVPLPQMAVIFQPMEPITAQDRSGVAFSHSPVETLPGVLIQAAFGTGQVVVGGYGGDLYSVQKDQVRVQPMPPAQIRVTGPNGDTVPQPSPPGSPLTVEEARELADLVLNVAERWGGPTNVEFVWRAGAGPLLVQVRSAK